ncbi:hypothetical protein N7499_012374 [Penicillium canescens]|nr:hypothetical protein N7499_012374 [Penicillium canescens]KAJ6154809.1 hypothetical protein N7485_013178 [Penicillium canescens]
MRSGDRDSAAESNARPSGTSLGISFAQRSSTPPLSTPRSSNPAVAELGNWLQRLLHIPTRRPLYWRPGNRALSYTWGRFELQKDDRFPDVNAVEIHDVGWTIPRIHPDHFTVDNLLEVIDKGARKSVDKLQYTKGPAKLILGDTVMGTSEGKSYNLHRLEDQFGSFLLKEYPVESQMHIFRSEQDFGKGWHMNRQSRIPNVRHPYHSHGHPFRAIFPQLKLQEPLCKLEARRLRESQIMGYFSGQLCSAHDLLEAIHNDETVEIFAALDCHKYPRYVSSDLIQLLKLIKCRHWWRTQICKYETSRRFDQNQLERDLAKIRNYGIKVLRLGRLKLGEHEFDRSERRVSKKLEKYGHKDKTLLSGLILHQETTGHWRRLGIFLWKLGGSVEGYAEDLGVEWMDEEVYFG